MFATTTSCAGHGATDVSTPRHLRGACAAKRTAAALDPLHGASPRGEGEGEDEEGDEEEEGESDDVIDTSGLGSEPETGEGAHAFACDDVQRQAYTNAYAAVCDPASELYARFTRAPLPVQQDVCASMQPADLALPDVYYPQFTSLDEQHEWAATVATTMLHPFLPEQRFVLSQDSTHVLK